MPSADRWHRKIPNAQRSIRNRAGRATSLLAWTHARSECAAGVQAAQAVRSGCNVCGSRAERVRKHCRSGVQGRPSPAQCRLRALAESQSRKRHVGQGAASAATRRVCSLLLQTRRACCRHARKHLSRSAASKWCLSAPFHFVQASIYHKIGYNIHTMNPTYWKGDSAWTKQQARRSEQEKRRMSR